MVRRVARTIRQYSAVPSMVMNISPRLASVRLLSVLLVVFALTIGASAFGQNATMTTVGASGGATKLGEQATITATVTDLGPGSFPLGTNALAGRVLFTADSTLVLGSARTLGGTTATTATLHTPLLSVATHTVTAQFFADNTGQFTGSTDAVGKPYTVNPRGTTAGLAALSAITVRSTGSGAVTVTDENGGTAGTFANNATYALLTARSGHTATLLPDGRILVVGGQAGGAVLASGSPEMWSPSAFATFTPTTGTFAARTGATATLLQDGRVLIVGGFDGTNALASAEIFDPANGANGTVTATGSVMTARQNHAATLLPDGKVLITGGADTAGTALVSPNQIEIYDPSLGTFAKVAGDLAVARAGHTATLLTSGPNAGKILLTGGGNASYELYTVTGTTGSSGGSLAWAAAPTDHTATLLADGNVLLTGGGATASSSDYIYDASSNTIVDVTTSAHPLGTARTDHTATLLNDSTVVLIGGLDATPTELSGAEIYTPGYDPQGTVSLTSLPVDATNLTLGTCTSLTISGTGKATCSPSIKPVHYGSAPYNITATYAASTNHSTSNSSGTPRMLTINKVAITLQAVTETRVYNQTVMSSGAPTVAAGGPKFTGDTTTQVFDLKDAGARTLTPDKIFNGATDVTADYTITPLTIGGTISQKPITASGILANPTTRVYNQSTVATLDKTGAALTGGATNDTDNKYYSGDTVNLDTTSATGSVANKNVGTNKAVTVSGLALTGTDSGNYTLSDASGATLTITQKPITATGITANNKVYNTTNVAALNLGSAAIIGGASTDTDNKFYTGDTVNLNTTSAAGNFANKNAGTAKAVTVTGLALTGTDAGNYSVSDASGATANITQKPITATAITASNKVYNANTVATLALGSAAITGGAATDTDNKFYNGDTVNLNTTSAAGNFANKNVGTGKAVTITGLALTGTDAPNYSVSDASSATANITAKPITASGIVASPATRIYNQSTVVTLDKTAATLTGGAANDTDNKFYTGDTVSVVTTGVTGAAATKDVGTNKAVAVSGLTLTGVDSGNYTVTDASSATLTITRKAITASGITANNKVYSANTVASLNTGTGTLTGGAASDTDNRFFTSDSVVLNSSGAAGAFADKNVGNGKPVMITSLALTGTDAGDYSVSDASGATANITPKAITASGITANSRVYNASTVVTLSTGAAVLTSGAVSDTDNKFYSGDIVNVVATAATGAFANKRVGTGKPVAVSGLTPSGTDAPNYTITDASGATADITPFNLTITGVVAQNKTYDANTTATVDYTSASVNSFTGDAVTLVSSGYSATFADPNVASGIAVTVLGNAISGTDAPNYTLSQPAGLGANITKRPIVVSAVANSKIYGNADPTLSFVVGPDALIPVSGLATGETQAMVFTGNVMRAAGENAGSYSILQNTAAPNGNYTISAYNPATFTINPAATAVAVDTQVVVTNSGGAYTLTATVN
ncbi:MAG: YDG domain-containing protein, partial [Terriglobales bacterium]